MSRHALALPFGLRVPQSTCRQIRCYPIYWHVRSHLDNSRLVGAVVAKHLEKQSDKESCRWNTTVKMSPRSSRPDEDIKVSFVNGDSAISR